MSKTSDPAGLRDFKIPLQKIAPLTGWTSRDGVRGFYRLYPAWSENLVVLWHGLGGDSRYLCALAAAVSEAGLASVVTPDLPGHGQGADRPELATVDGPDRLVMVAEELLVHLRSTRAAERVVLGGHSLGAGLALRTACESAPGWVRGSLLLAPYLPNLAKAAEPAQNELARPAFEDQKTLGDLKHGAGFESSDFGGWMKNENGEWRVMMPESYQTGHEVLRYDPGFLKAAEPPLVVSPGLRVAALFGENDQIFSAVSSASWCRERYGAITQILPGASHMAVATSKPALTAAMDLLEQLL